MRMCQPHWDKLRAAIDARNLTQFVSGSGSKAVEKIETSLSGAPIRDTFDPLMGANFAIFTNSIRMGGLYLLTTKEDGTSYCPICEAVAHSMHDEDWWISNAADEQKTLAVELGLLSAQEHIN